MSKNVLLEIGGFSVGIALATLFIRPDLQLILHAPTLLVSGSILTAIDFLKDH